MLKFFSTSLGRNLNLIYNIHISRLNKNEVILLFIKQTVSLEIMENSFLRSHVNAADIVHNSPCAIHVVSNSGVMVYANKRELDIIEYSADEYIGRQRMQVLFQ